MIYLLTHNKILSAIIIDEPSAHGFAIFEPQCVKAQRNWHVVAAGFRISEGANICFTPWYMIAMDLLVPW